MSSRRGSYGRARDSRSGRDSGKCTRDEQRRCSSARSGSLLRFHLLRWQPVNFCAVFCPQARLTIKRLAERIPGNTRSLAVERAHGDHTDGDQVGREVAKYQAKKNQIRCPRAMHVVQDDGTTLCPESVTLHDCDAKIGDCVPTCRAMPTQSPCSHPLRSDPRRPRDALLRSRSAQLVPPWSRRQLLRIAHGTRRSCRALRSSATSPRLRTRRGK